MARRPADPVKLIPHTLIPPPGITLQYYSSSVLAGHSMGNIYLLINVPPDRRVEVAQWLRQEADRLAVASNFTVDGETEGKDLGVLLAMKQAGMLTKQQVEQLDRFQERQRREQAVNNALDNVLDRLDPGELPVAPDLSGLIDGIMGAPSPNATVPNVSPTVTVPVNGLVPISPAASVPQNGKLG